MFVILTLIGVWVSRTAFAPYGWRIKAVQPWGWHIVLTLPYSWHMTTVQSRTVSPQYAHSRDHDGALVGRGRVLWEAGKYDEAAKCFRAELKGPYFGGKPFLDAMSQSYLAKLVTMKDQNAKAQKQKHSADEHGGDGKGGGGEPAGGAGAPAVAARR